MWNLLNIRWTDWSWSWNSNTLAMWCEELTQLKRSRCWERLKVRGEGDDRGWDGWMASLTQWTWAWVSSGSWWWTGKPGMLQSMRSQRVRHDWATELNWNDIWLSSALRFLGGSYHRRIRTGLSSSYDHKYECALNIDNQSNVLGYAMW